MENVTTLDPEIAAALQKPKDELIARLRTLPPDNPLVKANQHILNPTSASGGWAGGDMLSFASFYWYAMSVELIGAGTSFAILFDAKGHSWGAWATFECEIGGYFVVDPKSVNGPVNFVLAGGAVGEGAVTLTLYSQDGTYYGSFAGNADGIGGVGIDGTGTLTAA